MAMVGPENRIKAKSNGDIDKARETRTAVRYEDRLFNDLEFRKFAGIFKVFMFITSSHFRQPGFVWSFNGLS